MKPIRTDHSNYTYLGPEASIANLPCRRDRHSGAVYAVFQLTDEERKKVANGGQIELGIYNEPIPPVSMNVVSEAEVIGPEEEDDYGCRYRKPDYRCKRCRALYTWERAVELEVICGQCGGPLSIPGLLHLRGAAVTGQDKGCGEKEIDVRDCPECDGKTWTRETSPPTADSRPAGPPPPPSADLRPLPPDDREMSIGEGRVRELEDLVNQVIGYMGNNPRSWAQRWVKRARAVLDPAETQRDPEFSDPNQKGEG
jgi:hypothetical protein